MSHGSSCFRGFLAQKAAFQSSENPLTGALLLRHGVRSCGAWPLLGSATFAEQKRFVARVRVHRFAGVVPLKIRSPKSEWYIQAEKEFLSQREQVGDLRFPAPRY